MADVIKCPSCGENNPADAAFCQFCQTRLAPSTGNLQGNDGSIKPGQLPTKKSTAELEPILPQWLRDARQKAQQDDDQPEEQKLPPQVDARTRPVKSNDLLDGLQSQAGDDEEEETPDWLANITGVQPKEKTQTDSGDVRWVELGSNDPNAEEEDEVPAWLEDLKSQETDAKTAGQDDSNDWMNNLTSPVQSESEKPLWIQEEEPALPELTSMDSPDTPLDIPDWLKGMDSPSEPAQSMEMPEITESSPAEAPEPVKLSDDDLPSWMKGLDDSSASDQGMEMPGSVDLESNKPPQPKTDTTPAWLRKKDPDTKEVPAWLANQNAVSPSKSLPGITPVDSGTSDEMPDWLKTASSEPMQRDELREEAPEPAQSGDMPDWLNSMHGDTIDVDTFPLPRSAAADDSSQDPLLPDLGNAGFDGSTGNLESLFSDAPDWLSNVSEDDPLSVPDAITKDDAISPGELPSWVQAMRPVDGSSSPISSSSLSDQTLESRGALAGLQGVLPAVPGFTPTSKPKAYSIKLQATEEHLAHAALLEQILSAETEPVPIASFSALRTSNALRWFITAIVALLVIFPLFSAAPIFALPTQYSGDLQGALNVTQSIPEGAPVLIAMDYEPARVGEMESAATPLLDQIILLRHPHLTFVTSNETGSILAERLITVPLAGHGYQKSIQYLNLGYLPGGQMGIRAFAQNPRATSPMDTTFTSAWTGTPLEGITSLSQFSAIVLITDDADSARAWIEQTQSIRGGIPFLVVSSAQAAPMIQPYFASGQISGQVAGLYGGAIFEQYNNGRPGTAAAYWDSYSLGMLLAMALILGGGLWNLFLGLRDRSAERDLE